MAGPRGTADLRESRKQIEDLRGFLDAAERTLTTAERIGIETIVMDGHAQMRKAHYLVKQFNANLRRELSTKHFDALVDNVEAAAPPAAKKSPKAGR